MQPFGSCSGRWTPLRTAEAKPAGAHDDGGLFGLAGWPARQDHGGAMQSSDRTKQTHRIKLSWLAAMVLGLTVPGSLGAAEPSGGALAGQRPRVIVSSDIGGSDPDDFQSMVHLLMYADVLDVEGLVSSPPHAGRARHILECLDAYEHDFAKLKRAPARYPEPATLREMVKQGAVDPSPQAGFSRPTEGSRWIVECAKREDQRPLWVLVWGSITDVAQAVHDAPAIKARLRVYSIGSWNTRNDPAARDYLFEHHSDLWWIESDTTFRGMYMGGLQEKDLGNRTFVENHVKDHGALGDLFYAKKRDIKMGDSPSVLFLLRGNPDDPSQPSWGGSYVRTDHGPNYWHDDPREEARDEERDGARTVNRWRPDYLRDWQRRMDWVR